MVTKTNTQLTHHCFHKNWHRRFFLVTKGQWLVSSTCFKPNVAENKWWRLNCARASLSLTVCSACRPEQFWPGIKTASFTVNSPQVNQCMYYSLKQPRQSTYYCFQNLQKLKLQKQFVVILGPILNWSVWNVHNQTSYEAVSGWGPGFDLFEDKSLSAFMEMIYANILVPKFSWHIQLFIHVWHL